MNAPAHWLDVVGIDESGAVGLSPQVRELLLGAKVLIGPQRLLEVVRELGAAGEYAAWQPPLQAMIAQVLALRGRQAVVLATGDPNWFGIGATLCSHLDRSEYRLHPAVSSLQLAAARLCWPLQDVAIVSLHGRPVSALQPHLVPGNRILALTSDRATGLEVGEMLVARGYGGSDLHLLEWLGGPRERVQSASARGLLDLDFGDFYVLGVQCVADEDAPLLASVPGLADERYVTDGQLTKRDVRAITLARLAPYAGAHLWDVGAGSGSIAIEWMRASRGGSAAAFERDAARCALIATNSANLGTPGLEIIQGSAPDCLSGQRTPDAIFIGGAVKDAAVFDACWQALRPSGRLVCNAVSIDGERALYERYAALGGELVRISISYPDQIGGEQVMRARLPVTQWSVSKGAGV